MSRAQVDLINFQTMPDGDYKYIMTYLNHFTKFCILSPLKSKRAEEVASKLLEIFLTFGAPSILQSDNERKTCWPELKLVTGRPSHPQSKSAVERLNGIVQDKLAIWIVHETTGQSPFKVTFDEEPPTGLKSYVLPKSLVRIGQNTTLRVPDVNRGHVDLKNFLVVIMTECEGLYTVGYREGKLAYNFTAADLQVISEKLLSIDEVPDDEIPLRTAVSKATGGQGYVKCMCLSGCSSGRCSCSRKTLLCNSRCHPGKSCKNI
ncbi:SCAN domain-containing protein 3 [Trichinella zimbabwensis]|uniref:SCAN domain-containing protein 3 n=1 Tax=Trichinella zimbabwensis TaxID=268475 RepID=A0A0V1HKK5_9BILA|nr:SCAN domain-containing protein 3 [Trichinella zimbabwensis]